MPDLGLSHLLDGAPDFVFAAAMATAGLGGSGMSEIAAEGAVLPRDGSVFERVYLSADITQEVAGHKRSQRVEAKEDFASDDTNLEGRTLWYSFSVFLEPDMVLPQVPTSGKPAKLSVAQFHQRDAKGRSDKPALMFYIQPSGDLVAQFEQAVGKRAYTLVEGGTLGEDALGRWVDVIVGAKWGREDAWTELWVRTGNAPDYTPIARDYGPNTSTGHLFFKYGLYRSFVERDPRLASTDGLAYYDAVRRAGSFEAVRLPPPADHPYLPPVDLLPDTRVAGLQ
ncbi:MAG: heparin lyase I family protein [Dinoroseobacter sp.]|nr:heparin lyase I family protein [Dinoroseobacter sp.]